MLTQSTITWINIGNFFLSANMFRSKSGHLIKVKLFNWLQNSKKNQQIWEKWRPSIYYKCCSNTPFGSKNVLCALLWHHYSRTKKNTLWLGLIYLTKNFCGLHGWSPFISKWWDTRTCRSRPLAHRPYWKSL